MNRRNLFKTAFAVCIFGLVKPSRAGNKYKFTTTVEGKSYTFQSEINYHLIRIRRARKYIVVYNLSNTPFAIYHGRNVNNMSKEDVDRLGYLNYIATIPAGCHYYSDDPNIINDFIYMLPSRIDSQKFYFGEYLDDCCKKTGN